MEIDNELGRATLSENLSVVLQAQKDQRITRLIAKNTNNELRRKISVQKNDQVIFGISLLKGDSVTLTNSNLELFNGDVIQAKQDVGNDVELIIYGN